MSEGDPLSSIRCLTRHQKKSCNHADVLCIGSGLGFKAYIYIYIYIYVYIYMYICMSIYIYIIKYRLLTVESLVGRSKGKSSSAKISIPQTP